MRMGVTGALFAQQVLGHFEFMLQLRLRVRRVFGDHHRIGLPFQKPHQSRYGELLLSQAENHPVHQLAGSWVGGQQDRVAEERFFQRVVVAYNKTGETRGRRDAKLGSSDKPQTALAAHQHGSGVEASNRRRCRGSQSGEFGQIVAHGDQASNHLVEIISGDSSQQLGITRGYQFRVGFRHRDQTLDEFTGSGGASKAASQTLSVHDLEAVQLALSTQKGETFDVIHGFAVANAASPRTVVSHHTAHAGVLSRGGIGSEHIAVGFQLLVEIVENQTGFGLGPALLRHNPKKAV